MIDDLLEVSASSSAVGMRGRVRGFWRTNCRAAVAHHPQGSMAPGRNPSGSTLGTGTNRMSTPNGMIEVMGRSAQ